ncbi:MAG: hypothetical protein ACK55I_14660, partial [bacterium]
VVGGVESKILPKFIPHTGDFGQKFWLECRWLIGPGFGFVPRWIFGFSGRLGSVPLPSAQAMGGFGGNIPRTFGVMEWRESFVGLPESIRSMGGAGIGLAFVGFTHFVWGLGLVVFGLGRTISGHGGNSSMGPREPMERVG